VGFLVLRSLSGPDHSTSYRHDRANSGLVVVVASRPVCRHPGDGPGTQTTSPQGGRRRTLAHRPVRVSGLLRRWEGRREVV